MSQVSTVKKSIKKQEVVSKKKGFVMPHTYVILFAVILFMALLTYVIPAGEYSTMVDENTGRTVLDAASFTTLEQSPVSLFQVLQSIPKGIKATSGIVIFIFMVGGAFQMISDTGAIEAGIQHLASKLQGKEKLMIPIFVIIFSIGGGTIGMAEEVMIFVPIGIALSRALGYDALVGTAMVSLGAACGFTSGFMNPFSVGVAQGIAELPLFSGIGVRLAILVAMNIITIAFISNYAKKIKADPTKSFVYELEQREKGMKTQLDNLGHLENRQKLVLLTLVGGLGVIVFGVFNYGWYITEIGSVFLAIGLIGGLIGGNGPSKIADSFVVGAKAVIFGALAVGIARGILVVMEDGMILHSMINGMGAIVSMIPKSITALGMYATQIVINFFIPSGSGQAAATMPIMIPLSDIVNINRQVTVLAYQFGDGFTNSIIPTSGVLLAYLSIANIKYQSWVKFIWPLMLVWIAFGGIVILAANAMNFGPF